MNQNVIHGPRSSRRKEAQTVSRRKSQSLFTSAAVVQGISAALVILIAGCARFHSEPISAEKSANELEGRSLTNAALKVFLEKNLHREFAEWPPTTWDFDALTLAAFYYHPDLALARVQWRATQGGIKTAGGRPNPTLSLVPGYDTTHNPGLSPWFPMVSFDHLIETAGKRGKRIAAAEQESE